MEKYNEMKEFVNSLETDFTKFFASGNKAAGTRLRKAMQQLKSMAQEIRLEIQNAKMKNQKE